MEKRARKTDKFTVTEVGALIEDLRSQFKVFGEGLKDLREKVDGLKDLREKVDGLNDLREKFDTLTGKVDTLTGIVNHEAKKSDLSRIDIADLKTDVANLKNTVVRIEKDIRLIRDNLASKVDHKDFELLEKKVAYLQ